MAARSAHSTLFATAGAMLLAFSSWSPASAQVQANPEGLLYASYGKAIFIDADFNLACTGCRYEGVPGKRKDAGKVVISDKIGAGLSPKASVGNFLVLREDQGTSCPAGGWYALQLETLTLSEIKTAGCSEVAREEYAVSGSDAVVVTLTHYDKKKVTTKLK